MKKIRQNGAQAVIPILMAGAKLFFKHKNVWLAHVLEICFVGKDDGLRIYKEIIDISVLSGIELLSLNSYENFEIKIINFNTFSS
jgi:hypothetical protein